MKVVVPENLVGSYVSGVMFAGYYFAQRNPDWRDRLVDMAVYSVGWPVNVVRDVFETLNMLVF